MVVSCLKNKEQLNSDEEYENDGYSANALTIAGPFHSIADMITINIKRNFVILIR